MLEEQAFDPGRHDREGFTCGVPVLDDWLQRFATQQRRKAISTVFVLVDSARPSAILGYYSLSAAELDSAVLGEADRRKLPRYRYRAFAWDALHIAPTRRARAWAGC